MKILLLLIATLVAVGCPRDREGTDVDGAGPHTRVLDFEYKGYRYVIWNGRETSELLLKEKIGTK